MADGLSRLRRRPPSGIGVGGLKGVQAGAFTVLSRNDAAFPLILSEMTREIGTWPRSSVLGVI